MDLKYEKIMAYLFPLLLTIVFVFTSNQTTINGINRSLALSGLAVVGLTFLIGPLSRYSKRINRLKIHRRYLGLAGFAILLVHAAISFWRFFSLDIGLLLDPSDPLFPSALSGSAAFLIFLAMSLTSTTAAMRAMGRNWKRLQNAGYIAMVLAMLHFAGTQLGLHGSVATNLVAWAVFILGIVVVLARVYVYLISMNKRK